MKEQVSRKLWWLSVGLTVLLTVVLTLIDQPLHTEAAPLGIVSFELAGNQLQAQNIIASWTGLKAVYAGFSLGIDYLYLLCYSSCFALTALLLAVRRDGKWRKAGLIVATMMPLVALCDALENYCLWQMLSDAPSQELAAIAFLSASFKFVGILIAIVYILICLSWKRQQIQP